MAKKKSRTSNKKSNDNQKKLLALVLIILFIGLGVFLVVSSFAAKGGGKGKPGSGTITYVDSPYALKADGGVYGGKAKIYITDKAGTPLQSLISPFTPIRMSGHCYPNGLQEISWSLGTGSTDTYVETQNSSYYWTSGGASCDATLFVNTEPNSLYGNWQPTATVNYTVAP
jgi:hypothetical protein